MHFDAYCTVLAGGIGRRFWPASTPTRPKQLLPLAGSLPLIDQTLARAAALVGARRVRVIASKPLLRRMRRAVAAAGVGELVEPRARGTGPALVWAASEIEREAPGAVMISLHADHRITPEAALREALEPAVEAARAGYLCCVGVRPRRPETGFGYVEPGRELRPAEARDRGGGRVGATNAGGARVVRRFVEKPARATAEAYVDAGWLWNSGIFVWRAADLLAAARAHATELADGWAALARGDAGGFFARVQAIPIDVCVLERAERVATVEADFDWDDLGVWNALPRARAADGEGNVVVGSARLRSAADNVVWTETRRATVIGVSGLVVVEANGELLVMPRHEAAALEAHLRRLEAEEPSGEAPP